MLKVIASVHTVLVVICIQPQSLRLPCSLVEYPYTLPPQDRREGRRSLHQAGAVVNQDLLLEIARL